MAKNLRPSQWNSSGGWEDKSYADIEIAQNQYDLLVAQEKANELKQQEIKNQKEMQERQLQHEADMREKDRQAEKDNILAQYALMELEEARKQKERKVQLCDEHDIDYNDIQGFIQYLNTPEDNTLQKVEELYTKRNNYEKQRQRLIELNDEINNLKLKKSMKQPTNIKEFSLTQLVCYILIFFGLVLGIPGILMNGVMDPTPLIVIDIMICIALYLIGKVAQISETRKANNRLKNESRNFDKEIQEYEQQKSIENIPENILTLVQDTDREIRDMQEEVDKDVTNKRNKFNEFRKTHYNDEMEKLLRKLEIEGLDTIREKDATKKGTKKDYIRYMEQYL